MKLLYLLSALLFFNSCANQQGNSSAGNFPDWYNSAPLSTSKVFYAVGKGTQKDHAIKNALYSISKQVKVIVSSSYKELERTNKDFGKNIIEENLINDVARISTSGFKITKEQKLSKTEFAVLIELNKSIVIAQYNEKLRKVEKEISDEIGNEDFNFLRDRYKTQNHLSEMKLILKVLSSFGDDKSEEYQREQEYRERFFNRLSGLSFRIVRNSDDFSHAERIIENEITNAGYKIAERNQPHSFLISISGRVNRDMQGRLFTVKQRLEVRIQSERGDIFAAKIIEESSTSNLSFNDAIANSGGELRNQLRRKGVESFFEFEN